MRDLPIRSIGAHVQEFRGDRTIEDEIAMVQPDFLHRLVSPRDALRDSSVTDVGLLIGRVGRWIDETTGHDGGRARIAALEEGYIGVLVYAVIL